MGPVMQTDCRSCGRPISVSWLATAAGLPLAATIATARLTDTLEVLWVLPITLVLSILLHLYMVPMVRR